MSKLLAILCYLLVENAIGFVLINSEINKHLPESRRKLHNKPSLDCKILENQNFIQIYWYG